MKPLNPPKTKFPQCSFCGKLKSEVRMMIASRQGALICDQCVRKMANDLKGPIPEGSPEA